MAKPKAPAWLREAFAEGVLELAPPRPAPAYKGALGRCWLAQHDERQWPCSGPFERFHFISRQRVEAAMWEHLREAVLWSPDEDGVFPHPLADRDRDDLILLAAWDPRNGGVGCEGHHRRYDSHLTPSLSIPRPALPGHVIEFAMDWGLESQFFDTPRFHGPTDNLRLERTA